MAASSASRQLPQLLTQLLGSFHNVKQTHQKHNQDVSPKLSWCTHCVCTTLTVGQQLLPSRHTRGLSQAVRQQRVSATLTQLMMSTTALLHVAAVR
jgi:hypothetical protein